MKDLAALSEIARREAHEAPMNKVYQDHTGHRFLGTHSTAWASAGRRYMAAKEAERRELARTATSGPSASPPPSPAQRARSTMSENGHVKLTRFQRETLQWLKGKHDANPHWPHGFLPRFKERQAACCRRTLERLGLVSIDRLSENSFRYALTDAGRAALGAREA